FPKFHPAPPTKCGIFYSQKQHPPHSQIGFLPADSAPRLFARKERNLTAYIFRTKMFHVEQKSREERGMFHVEHKKERAAGGVNVPRGTSPKKTGKKIN
ncbi:MAG TPA: hypothetical protein H9927_05595, partial [Candidatus Alistipes merdipullorum]|nr:hypothetical protein [Candidatus Alistipes merdipullorum]